MTRSPETGRWSGARRGGTAGLLLLATLTVSWWVVVRATAGGRALVHRGAEAPASAVPPDAGDLAATDTIRVLAWNIAHARGDLLQGSVQNFRGGDPEARTARLARMAAVIREADADVVALNEVDFDAAWSGGLNHAETLARAAGYEAWVEQRNFDYGVLFADFAFGNALLTRLPVRSVRPLAVPPYSRLEAALIGAKTGAVVELETAAGLVAVVPIHLEFRSEATRLAAVAPLRALRDAAAPLILAGDFNTSPPGWPGVGDSTAVGTLLQAGWQSPRAEREPSRELTFPSADPRAAIDWVLVEPPLRVLEARVLDGDRLSDHRPVLAVVEVVGRPPPVVRRP